MPRRGREVTVSVRPKHSRSNPYPSMFASALENERIKVLPLKIFSRRNVSSTNIFILHWPDEFIGESAGYLPSMKTFLKAAGLLLLKHLIGKRTVWIAHNIIPHDSSAFGAQSTIFFKSLSGVIYLSGTAKKLTEEAVPSLRYCNSLVVGHGHYREIAHTMPKIYSPPKGAVIHLAFFGQIRAYKGIDDFASIAAAMAGVVHLSIAGRADDLRIASKLKEIALLSPNVTIRLDHLPELELEQFVDEADGIVLPYRNIVNSGSALFALSRNKPILAPNQGSLVELREQVGDEWVYLYEGDLTQKVVLDYCNWLRNAVRSVPNLADHGWDTIGRKVANFLRGG